MYCCRKANGKYTVLLQTLLPGSSGGSMVATLDCKPTVPGSNPAISPGAAEDNITKTELLLHKNNQGNKCIIADKSIGKWIDAEKPSCERTAANKPSRECIAANSAELGE